MPLIKCPECNQQISDKAISCPQCGFPLEGMKKDEEINNSQKAVLSDDSQKKIEVTRRCGNCNEPFDKKICPDCGEKPNLKQKANNGNSKLIACADCGHMISKDANKCPNCDAGTPNTSFGSFLSYIVILIILGIIGSCLGIDCF